MDDFDKYFEKASQINQHVSSFESQHQQQPRRSSFQNENKKGKSKKEDFQKSDVSKRSRSIHHPNHDNQPPICVITPDDDEQPFHQNLRNKRGSRDHPKDSLKVAHRQLRRHSINPEEITASKLQEINKLQNDDCLIVRSFLTSPKGLVDRGDSFKRRASHIGERLPSPAQMLELSSSFKRRLSDASKTHGSSGGSSGATIADLISANASATSENQESICLDPVDKRFQKPNKRFSIEAIKGYSLDSNVYHPEINPPPTINKPSIKRNISHELSNVVIVLGDARVGKSSLITQFLSSEHLMGFDNFSENTFENIISIYVDGEETLLNFIEADLKTCKSLEDIPRNSDCKAYLVVYSITDSASFQTAKQLLKTVCMIEESHKKGQIILGKRNHAVILVANKGDLVRNRKVSETEAREVCKSYECKYMEVSSALSHNVNELLVGIVQQIKLNDKRKSHERKLSKSFFRKSSKANLSHSSSEGLVTSPSSLNSYFKWFKRLFTFKNKQNQFDCDNMQTL